VAEEEYLFLLVPIEKPLVQKEIMEPMLDLATEIQISLL
jgi:hypothetical protein